MPAAVTFDYLTEQLELADQLLAGRAAMLEPQDLPGRYGRAVRAVDRVLAAMGCPAVLGGGWAVWRHGYVGRVTQDMDIVLPADRVDEFLRVAAVSGFEVLPQPPGRWPKLQHKDADVKVDILPEGARPGTASRPAPTLIPHPTALGATGATLRYVALPALVALKLAAGRARDEADVTELIRANPGEVPSVRVYLAALHADYAAVYDRLTERARDQRDE